MQYFSQQKKNNMISIIYMCTHFQCDCLGICIWKTQAKVLDELALHSIHGELQQKHVNERKKMQFHVMNFILKWNCSSTVNIYAIFRHAHCTSALFSWWIKQHSAIDGNIIWLTVYLSVTHENVRGWTRNSDACAF